MSGRSTFATGADKVLKVGFVSPRTGALGGFGANHALRQSMVFLNVPMLQMPEAYIGNAAALFDAEGALVNDSTRAFLQKFLAAFAQWIERTAAK